MRSDAVPGADGADGANGAGVPALARPGYLGLLNEISEAERRGWQYLTGWADMCSDPVVERALRTVAAREGEHCATFARRVVELGFRVRARADTEEERRRAEVALSDASDREKFEALGYRTATATATATATGTDAADRGGSEDSEVTVEADVFDGFFRDHSIDPVTGGLLGRFIAEERDSARTLRAAYQDLLARSGTATR